MYKRYKNDEEVSKIKFCVYHNNNCFECPYRLTDKYGLWCRVKGEYVYKYKTTKND